MRQIVSTAVVAVIVGALAGATMSAVAQTEPAAERAISPAAGINAATVDGKSAVGYTNKKNVRKGKLVAANKKGELPSNIVRPFWGLMRNVPAGFADGVDNVGVTNIKIQRVYGPASTVGPGPNGLAFADATCPAGSYVVGGGYDKGYNTSYDVYESYAPDGTSWRVSVVNQLAGNAGFTPFAMCMSTDTGTFDVARKGIAPAGSGPRNK